MANRQMLKCERIEDTLVWTDRETGEEVFRFAYSSVHLDLRDRVYEYGLRQILADGGASAKTSEERWGLMHKRAIALADGSWGKAPMPDSDIYLAAVRAGKITDSTKARDTWRGLKPAQRRAIGTIPEVAAQIAPADGDDAANLLEMF